MTATNTDSSAAPETPAAKVEKVEDKRTCQKCNETKVVSPETWVYAKNKRGIYAAKGFTCLACEKIRKADFDKKRKEFEALVSEDHRKKSDAKEAKDQSKLDAALALKLGARAINQISASVIARLAQYADDPDSEFHGMALEFFAQRIAPRKLYEEIGGEAAGLGALQDKRPQFVINIHPAKPTALPGATVEGEVLDVKVLPAPIPNEGASE